MSPWTFYTAPGTCALAVHIALHEAGARFDTVRLDFGRGEQRAPDYLAIHPLGRVPALRTPRGVLTEVPALLLFIAQSHPEAGLAPLDDAFALAELQAFNSLLASTVHVAHAHKRRGARWTDDAQAMAALQRYVPTSMAACAQLLEQRLAGQPWVLGERYSVADAYLYTIAGWLDGDGVPLAQYAALAAHHDRMGRRPAVQRALAEQAGPAVAGAI